MVDTPLLREAVPADADGLSDLLAELGHPLAPREVLGRLDSIAGAGDSYFVVVAIVGGGTAGVVSGFATPVLHRAAPVGRISVLVVGRAFRGTGLGSTLVREAEERLRVLGCARIEVTSAAHRSDAHEFYRRRGYRQEGLRFTREEKG